MLFGSVANVVMDVIVAVLPIRIVAKLAMPKKQRRGVMVLFSVGIVVIATGVTRIYFVWSALLSSYDLTWHTYPLWIASAIELDLGVVSFPDQLSFYACSRSNNTPQICACVPAIRPLFTSWQRSGNRESNSHLNKSIMEELSGVFQTIKMLHKAAPDVVEASPIRLRNQTFYGRHENVAVLREDTSSGETRSGGVEHRSANNLESNEIWRTRKCSECEKGF